MDAHYLDARIRTKNEVYIQLREAAKRGRYNRNKRQVTLTLADGTYSLLLSLLEEAESMYREKLAQFAQ